MNNIGDCSGFYSTSQWLSTIPAALNPKFSQAAAVSSQNIVAVGFGPQEPYKAKLRPQRRLHKSCK